MPCKDEFVWTFFGGSSKPNFQGRTGDRDSRSVEVYFLEAVLLNTGTVRLMSQPNL